MKAVPRFLVAVGAILSVASAVETLEPKKSESIASEVTSEIQSVLHYFGYGKNDAEKDDNINNDKEAEDDEPWEIGTKVLNNFPNNGGWSSGTITSYNSVSGLYTVTWEGGSFDDDWAGNDIDIMVALAIEEEKDTLEEHTSGTNVSYYDEGQWYNGVIVRFHPENRTYTIEWEDHHVTDDIPEGWAVDQMVQDARDEDRYHDGREVRVGASVSYFHDGRWTDGEITAYDPAKGWYTIDWADGNRDTYDAEDDDEWQELVQAVRDSFAVVAEEDEDETTGDEMHYYSMLHDETEQNV